jgi:hypothetical protein
MRFTSLVIELIRSRPAVVFWAAVLAQALMWFVVPMIFYASPPGETAMVLAIGREYQLGTVDGPPLAFWLADIAFKITGNHMLGVYLLAQACFVVTFWALFSLGRSLVGPQQAVIAVILTLTVTAFGFPGVEFGPDVLMRPLWALTLLHYWRAIGEGRRNAWFALSIEVGLLLLTSYAALLLVGLLVLFTLITRRGRQMLRTVDPWYSLVVIAALVFPHALWAVREGGNGLFVPLPSFETLTANIAAWPPLVGMVMVTLAGALLLVVLNFARFGPKADDVPAVIRPPLSAFARHFIVFFALAPLVVGSLLAAALGFDRIVGGAGAALMLTGLLIVLVGGEIIYLRRQRILRVVWAGLIAAPAIAVVGASLLLPWTLGVSVRTSQPAADIGRFFGDSFERRTGRRLPAVAGDPDLAKLIALTAPGRPQLLLDATPRRTPWQSPERFSETGGIVVWRAQDTVGAPPAEIRRRFPNLVPEVPRAFDRFNQGREPLPRIGWAIVRPRGG